MQNIYSTQNQDSRGKLIEDSNLESLNISHNQLSVSEQDKLSNLITHPEGQSKMTMVFDSIFHTNVSSSHIISSKKNKQRRHLLLARSKKKMQDDEEDEIVFTQNLSTVRGYAVSPKFFMKDDIASTFSSFSFQTLEDKQSLHEQENSNVFQFGTPENDTKKDSTGPRRRLTAKRRLKPTTKGNQPSENTSKISQNSQKLSEQTLSTGIATSTERPKIRPSKNDQNVLPPYGPTSRGPSKYELNNLNLGTTTKPRNENIDDNVPVLQPSLKRSKRKKDQAFNTNCDQDDLPTYLETDRNPPSNMQALREPFIPKSHIASQTRSRSILGAIDARMNAMGLGMRQTLQNSITKYNHPQTRSALDTHINDQKTSKSLSPFSTTYKHLISANHRNSNTDTHSHGSTQKDAWQQIIPLSRNLVNDDKEQRHKFMNFWINLSDQQRRDLLKIDKESVLKKIKEQQRRTCSCNVCGRRRSAVERELEMLYDAYCREIQAQTNLERASIKSNDDGTSDNEDNSELEDSEDLDIGKSLRVKGSLLILEDDMIKNKGKKFLLLLDKLNSLERKLSSLTKTDNNNKILENGQLEPKLHVDDETLKSPKDDSEVDNDSIDQSDDNISDANSDNDFGHDENVNYTERDSDTEGENDSDSDISLATEQRIKEGRKMFQMFAAKMFEQRVYAAFKEVMAFHNQQKLIQEEEAAVRLQQAKKDAKSKKAKQKKQRKKQQKQLLDQVKKQQEEEERMQLEEQRRLREEQERLEREKRRQIEEAQRKEKERHQSEKLLRVAQQKEKEKKKQQLKQEKEKEKNDAQTVSGNAQKKKKKKKNTKQMDDQTQSNTSADAAQTQVATKQGSKNQSVKVAKKTPSKLNPNAAPYTLSRTTSGISGTAQLSHVDDEDEDIANLLQNLIPAKLTLEDPSSVLGSSQDDNQSVTQNETGLSVLTESSQDPSSPGWTTNDHVNIPDFIPVYSFPSMHATSGVSLWNSKDNPTNNHMNFTTWNPTWHSGLVPGSVFPSSNSAETHFHFQPS